MKVHILVWLATGKIGGVYLDREKALHVAGKTNKKRSWLHRLHLDTLWVVQSFDVRD